MNRGILFALGAAVLFGLSTPLAQQLLGFTNPLLLAGLLYLGSGVGLAALRVAKKLARSAASPEAPLTRPDLPWLAGAIFAGGIAAPAFLVFGLLTTAASTASLLLNLESVATAVIAWVVFRENVDRRVGLGFACILAGAILLTIPAHGGLEVSRGALLVAAACLFWGIDNNLTRRISGSDPAQIAMWKGLVAGAVNTALGVALATSLPAAQTIAAIAAVGFFGYGLSLVLFITALRFLGTARTGAYFSTAPFVGAAVAVALGQGQITGLLLLSGLLMLAGVWLHLTERHEHPHIHEPTEHEHLHVHDEHHQHEHSPDDPPGEPHTHPHRHKRLTHTHPHFPDLHHRHGHE